MPRIRLTDTSIKAISSPTSGTVWYYDTDLAGFSLAVGTRKRTFYVGKSLNGKNVRKRVGEWPAVPAMKARKEATMIAADISQGNDPRRRRDGTLKEWLDHYIDTYTHLSHDRLSEATADQYRRVMKNHCASWLKRDIRLIEEEDVKALHRRLRESPHMANQVIRVLRSIQRHAGISPPPKFAWYKERRREQDILDLVAFGKAVAALTNPSKRAVWLLAVHTGIRRQSLLELQWSQVDLEEQTLFLPKMKNRLARTMPLSSQAVTVLRAMEGLHPKWVLPSFDGGEHLVEVRDPTLPHVFHNTRRVFTDGCASCLLPEYAIAYLRGDVVNQTMAQRYLTHIDLREPIERVGTFIEAAMTPKADLRLAA